MSGNVSPLNVKVKMGEWCKNKGGCMGKFCGNYGILTIFKHLQTV